MSFVFQVVNLTITLRSVMLAAKFFDDQYFNNAYYAKVGGVPCGEMNSLELEFLFLINFTLHVTHDAYQKYYRELVSHCHYSSPMGACPCGKTGRVLCYSFLFAFLFLPTVLVLFRSLIR